jgi:hypothetical protein
MEAHLRQVVCSSEGETREQGKRSLRYLTDCGEWLLFHHYYTIGDYKLVDACFCRQWRLCQLCAMRHGAKYLGRALERFEWLGGSAFRWYHVVLTVRDGPVLLERFCHLMDSWRALHNRGRDQRKKGRGRSVWRTVEGVLGAVEVTRGANSGEWHPHIHMAVCTVDALPVVQVGIRAGRRVFRCPGLEREWQGITEDSKVVHVEPFLAMQEPAAAFCEVFKYAVKFSSMSAPDVWRAYLALRGRHMTFSTGVLRGVVPPSDDDNLLDAPLEQLPFIELFYRYLGESGYTCTDVAVNTGVV